MVSRSVLLTTLVMALATRVPAQTPPADSFGAVVDVRIVNVDVYVTDRQGNPLAGLRAADFEVYEDGKRVELSNFEMLTDAAARPSKPDVVPEDSTKPAPPPPVQAAAAPPNAGLIVAVLFDGDHLRPASRQRALAQLRDFLGRSLRPEDRVILVTTGPASTAPPPARAYSANAVPALLTELGRATGAGAIRDLEWRNAIETMRGVFDSVGCGPQLEAVARNEAAQEEASAKSVLAELEGTVSRLARLPGEKALLFFSEGLPSRPGEELEQIISEWCHGRPQLPERDLSSRLRTVGAIANAGRVTIFTFEAGGMKGTTSASTGFAQNIFSLSADRVRIGGRQNSLTALAAETGGLAVLDRNDVGPDLARVAIALRNHYSLAFAPRTKPDGKEHRILVKVAKKGVELRYRQSYRG